MSKVSRCLVDTPLLVRLANSSDVLYPVALAAVTKLHLQGVQLCITPQNLNEFRNVATRANSENGLGYSIAQVEEKAEGFEALFTLLDDVSAIYGAWKTLVHQVGILGKQVHDARLIACCQVHSLDSVLTFNSQHFVRFLPYMPGWSVIDPHSV
jgi:predicted nucleic acid-binding protein